MADDSDADAELLGGLLADAQASLGEFDAQALGLDLEDAVARDELNGSLMPEIANVSSFDLPDPANLSPLLPDTSNTSSAMVADGGTDDWENLQLVIKQHSVHKLEYDETDGTRCYVVSNLRKFNIEVVLVDRATQQPATSNQLQLQAVLLYENGCAVKATESTGPLLLGETEVVVIQGCATFKLQMGKDILTSKLGKQMFRIRLEPIDRALREAYPSQLTILTEPLKSVTKLERKPPPPGNFRTNGIPTTVPPMPLGSSAAAQMPSRAPQPPHTIPQPGTTRQTSPPGIPGQRYPAVGGGSLFPPSPPRDEAAPGGGFNGSAAAGLSMSSLTQELESRQAHRTEIEDVVREQKAQIERLTHDNQQILAEMARLRAALTDRQNSPKEGRSVAPRSSGEG